MGRRESNSMEGFGMRSIVGNMHSLILKNFSCPRQNDSLIYRICIQLLWYIEYFCKNHCLQKENPQCHFFP